VTVGELKDCISALKAEVAELRNALAVKQATEAEEPISSSRDNEWTVVAKAKRRAHTEGIQSGQVSRGEETPMA